jgi:methionyl-tRNA formyltransferase
MKVKVTFLGNESPYLQVIKDQSLLHLVVCEKVGWKAKKYFGSSYDFARRNRIQIMEPRIYVNNPIATDLIIVSGYPKLISSRIINHPKIGIVNIHQSLLPAYGGRHPLNWTIINGEKYTGITIHHVNEKFDDGKIIFQERVNIGSEDTIMDVYYKTIEKGRKLLRKLLSTIIKDGINGSVQNKRLGSYFPPRTPEDGKINWKESAVKIKDLVRASAEPYPGAYFYYKGRKIILEDVSIVDNRSIDEDIGKPILVNGKVLVMTGNGTLEILKTRNFNWAFGKFMKKK